MTEPAPDILDRLPFGLVTADEQGAPVALNGAGKSLLALCGGGIPAPPDTAAREYRVRQNGRTIEVVLCPSEQAPLITLRDVTDRNPPLPPDHRPEEYAALGQLAENIAHDIRNPLGSIELLASLLKRSVKKERDIRHVDQIIASVKIVNSRISQLILSSQPRECACGEINIHDLLKDIMLFSEQFMDRGTIYLSVRTADIAPPLVAGNADMIRQVFLSLILLALQSLPPSGRLDIETVLLPAPPSVEIHFRAPGRDFLDRVSGREAGAGMGLAIIHQIMMRHGGSARIEQHGSTTAFILAFPMKTGNPLEPFEKIP